MKQKIDPMLERLAIVENLLGQSEIIGDQKRYRELTQEYSYLSKVRNIWEKLEKSRHYIKENRELFESEQDPDFRKVLTEDIKKLEDEIVKLEKNLIFLLVPPDPHDHRNTILELRAGTGGEEAALFVADCVRMYQMYADSQGWKYEMLSSTSSDMGGYKEYVMVLSGENVNRLLRHEGGTHRVQRVPETEAQGRVHTSAITVAVLLEPEEADDIELDDKDLRIDTYRSSGAGGQHVNTTDSAVRITHIPTGVVAYCQDERSQHKNRDKAMRYLKAKIAEAEQLKKQKERAETRSKQVGTGDRSERIRTYNFPQNRVTDHRIGLTLYNLDLFMEGKLDEMTSELIKLNE